MAFLCCLFLLKMLPIFVANTIPLGLFRTGCQDRHFWLAVRSSLLEDTFRFDVEDKSGVHTLSGQRAAECGYAMALDSQSDLVLRISFLACHVDNEKDSEYTLLLWFVNQNENGEESFVPLELSCPLLHPWSSREIVCEENYMEVSVKKQVPPSIYKGVEWMIPPSIGSDNGLREWRVVFRVPAPSEGGQTHSMTEEILPVAMAQLLGYHIKTSATRIVLRCAYGSRLSYTLQEKGTEMEIVSATILYKHQWTLLRVDTSVACTTSQAALLGSVIQWTHPKFLSPLVQHPLRDLGLRVGLGGYFLSECAAHRRGYEIEEKDGIVKIRIPFGAEGGYIKSQVVDGHYCQSYFVDLFYVQQWEDPQGALTSHLSFRPLSIIHLPQELYLINKTVSSEGMFSVVLGSFPHDVAMYNITLGNLSMSYVQEELLGFQLFHVPSPNGSHSYLLQVPFSHPLVSQQYVGDKYRRYTLEVTFTILISPQAEIFHHSATMEHDSQDVVLPRVDGVCTTSGVLLLFHHGNMDTQWRLYIGGHLLTKQLVELGGYTLVPGKDYFTMEIPLYSLGMAYEGLRLKGLAMILTVTVEDRETARVEHTFTQRCVHAVGQLLVCLPDNRMEAIVDTSSNLSPIDPRHTSLLDPTCVPLETDGHRAMYNFSLDSCGTTKTIEEGQIVYTNKVLYSPQSPLPTKGRDSPRLNIPVGCVRPVNGSHGLMIYQPNDLPLTPSAKPRLVRALQLLLLNRGRKKVPTAS